MRLTFHGVLLQRLVYSSRISFSSTCSSEGSSPRLCEVFGDECVKFYSPEIRGVRVGGAEGRK